MRTPLQKILAAAGLASIALVTVRGDQTAQPMTGRDPLEVARVLAARYPSQPIMSYIPALSWSGQLRLSQLTSEPQWREKAMKDLEAFTSGQDAGVDRTGSPHEPGRRSRVLSMSPRSLNHEAAAERWREDRARL